MPSVFDSVTLQQAREWVGALQQAPAYGQYPYALSSTSPNPDSSLNSGIQRDWLSANRAFIAGDHWQAGAAWAGPSVPPDTDTFQQVMAEIRKAFVSQNVIAEVVRRHSSGVIGREPAWGLSLARDMEEGEEATDAEQQLIDEAEAIVTEWWDKRDAHSTLQRAVDQMLWGSRGMLRVYVPQGRTDENGAVPQTPLEEALDYVYLESPDIAQSALVFDRGTMEQAGVYVFKNGIGVTPLPDGTGALSVLLANQDGEEHVELVYTDGEDTVQRLIGKPNPDSLAQNVESEARLRLGGHLTMFEMRRDPLISEQVRQNQKLINLAKTMMQRNVVQGGFLERLILNAQEPGEYITDPTTGKKTFQPDPIRVGAGTTNFIPGIRYTDDKGTEHMTTPSVHFRDPVSVKTFEETKQSAYFDILQETKQLYALISRDATTSGESRRQAMSDYLISLHETSPVVEAAGRWLIETALAMAAQFSGQPGRYEPLRATFDCRLNSGPVPAADQLATINMVKSTILSRQTGMQRLNVDDTDAELQRLASERDTFNMLEKYQEWKAAEDAGVPLLYVLRENEGWDDEAINELIAAQEHDQLHQFVLQNADVVTAVDTQGKLSNVPRTDATGAVVPPVPPPQPANNGAPTK